MISDLFTSLLDELSIPMKIKDLKPDSNNSCLIKFKTGVEIQLELDTSEEFLLIGTSFGPLRPGRYRENIFREALKANGMPAPRYGIFAYSKKADNLIMFDKLHLKDLTGMKIFDHIKPFTEKALVWKEALARGDIPSILSSSYASSSSGGIFGIRP